MKDWTKIQTFDRLYQAELCKDILEKNMIEAVIINARDSLFLIGDVDLYVKNEDEQKAKALIDEFEGLTKIDSFIMSEPIELFKTYLAQLGIETIIKRKEDSKYILENFELYIKNSEIERVSPILRGDAFKGWTKVDSCVHTRQAKFRIEILQEKDIKAIIIKKRDSNHHLEEIQIWVENAKLEIATKCLFELNGWIKIRDFDQVYRADFREDFLGKHAIKSIVRKESDTSFELFVECHNEEKAIELINEYKEWKYISLFETIIEAEFYKETLERNGISAVVINRKDSSFAVGEIELYVDEDDLDKAKEIINDVNKTESVKIEE